MIFDTVGNLYGTTQTGGSGGYGTVFQLVPAEGGWTEKVLFNFRNGSDGGFPAAGLIFDPSGNLYGATAEGGMGSGGTVFELTPSNGSWTYSLVYSFTGPPHEPVGRRAVSSWMGRAISMAQQFAMARMGLAAFSS